MPASIGVNLRVTGHCSQGGRRYMEDFFSVAYQQTEDEKDLEYAFFGIYDGHGGSEAATYAKEHLMENIVRQKNFWSDKDEDVLRAIKEGYIATHYAMWKEQGKVICITVSENEITLLFFEIRLCGYCLMIIKRLYYLIIFSIYVNYDFVNYATI